MTRVRLLLVAIGVASSSCARENATEKSVSQETKKPGPVTETPSSPCDDIVARWKSTLAKAAGSCTSDEGCACFNGGIDEGHGCGGVTDDATAKTLEKLSGEFRGAKCKSGVACAAWACTPKCVSGHCSK